LKARGPGGSDSRNSSAEPNFGCGVAGKTTMTSTGEYLPAEPTGLLRDHVFGFVRRQGDEMAAAVVPRLVTRLASGPESWPLGGVWHNTRLVLPGIDPSVRWRNIFTDRDVSELRLSEVFADFPVALLTAQS
jgi:maltooligosyltrehalose synthase